jgi:hypothetical protein
MLETATRPIKPIPQSRAIKALLHDVPSPRLSSLRQALLFADNQYQFLDRHWQRLGDIFTFRIPGEPPRVAARN